MEIYGNIQADNAMHLSKQQFGVNVTLISANSHEIKNNNLQHLLTEDKCKFHISNTYMYAILVYIFFINTRISNWICLKKL